MSYSLRDFCQALKTVRERKGITLDEISTITKIPASMFVALERGDLSHWPKGLFGREFFRAYAGAVGIREDSACKEFVRLFPDETVAEPIAPPAVESTPAAPPAVKTRSMLGTITQLFKRADRTTAETEQPEQKRKWKTDAHRVGPPSPPSRVRIKL